MFIFDYLITTRNSNDGYAVLLSGWLHLVADVLK